jgi:hypothetical protein
MKVRMLTSMAGEAISYQPGQVVDVSEAVGRAWCAASIAEPVAEKPIERAEKRITKKAK